MQITQKQRLVLEFIGRFHGRFGYSPTSREIATNFGYTQTAAINHLKALARKGAIRTTPRVSRSIVVL